MSKIRVVVTDYIEPDLAWEAKQFENLDVVFEPLQLKFAGPDELVAAASDADIVIVNMAKMSREVIDRLERTRLIIRHGVGYDNVDVDAATERGIVVSYVPDYCVDEVAQQAVMLIFACQRKLLVQSRLLKESSEAGKWVFAPVYPAYSLSGKTLGIVGCGRIGSKVYRMMQGFDMKYLICDPYLSETRKRELGIETLPLDEVLANADVVTVHTLLNEETYHLFDAPQFEMMKPTSILVNTARGGIVNLDALDSALRVGEIAGAGIDVYEQEPPDPAHPLLQNERAVCTPHLAWYSEESGWSIREKIVEDVRRFVQDQEPRYPINKDVELRFAD
jgi:D-3-phosphoglycerate dehydrogenase